LQAFATDRCVPIKYPRIQAAIDAGVNRDVVIVASGTCTGDGNRDLDFLGKAIMVRSVDPDDPNVVASTVMNAGGNSGDSHRGFYFHSGEGAESVVAGLTIRSASRGYGGGAAANKAVRRSPAVSSAETRP